MAMAKKLAQPANRAVSETLQRQIEVLENVEQATAAMLTAAGVKPTADIKNIKQLEGKR